MGRLNGRSAIVTGAAAGVGQALAIAYAAAGAKVVIADIGDASQTVERIREAGGIAHAVSCDVSNEAQVADMARTALDLLGSVDILVNNAGISPIAPVDAMPLDLWERVFAVNVRGAFLASRAIVPGMKERGQGKIINLASALFFAGAPALSAYVASKGAIVGMTRALARELGDFNIQVNALAPGMIDTPGVIALGLPPEATEGLTQGQCIKRRETTDDLIGAALLLASADSDFITGQVLVVDGGFAFH